MHWPNNWRKEISNGVTMTMKSNVKFVFIQFLFASCELKLLLCQLLLRYEAHVQSVSLNSHFRTIKLYTDID